MITTDWGCFTENVIHGKTGYRCRTLDHFTWAARNIGKIKPADCRKFAMDNFSLDRVRWMYEEYFNMLLDIKCGKGWNEIHTGRTQLDWLNRVYPWSRRWQTLFCKWLAFFAWHRVEYRLDYKYYHKEESWRKVKVKLPKCKCLRCSHEWTPRREDVRQCPQCKSVRWDVAKVKPKRKWANQPSKRIL